MNKFKVGDLVNVEFKSINKAWCRIGLITDITLSDRSDIFLAHVLITQNSSAQIIDVLSSRLEEIDSKQV